jgi:hypothetical protein
MVHLVERLDNNLSNALLQLEHTRMHLRSAQPTLDMFRPELEEMRFLLTRGGSSRKGVVLERILNAMQNFVTTGNGTPLDPGSLTRTTRFRK